MGAFEVSKDALVMRRSFGVRIGSFVWIVERLQFMLQSSEAAVKFLESTEIPH